MVGPRLQTDRISHGTQKQTKVKCKRHMATKNDRSHVLKQTRPREQFQSRTLTQGQNKQHERHDPVTKLKIRPTKVTGP